MVTTTLKQPETIEVLKMHLSKPPKVCGIHPWERDFEDEPSTFYLDGYTLPYHIPIYWQYRTNNFSSSDDIKIESCFISLHKDGICYQMSSLDYLKSNEVRELLKPINLISQEEIKKYQTNRRLGILDKPKRMSFINKEETLWKCVFILLFIYLILAGLFSEGVIR